MRTRAASLRLAVFIILASAIALGQAHITQAVLGMGISDKEEFVNPTNKFTPDNPKNLFTVTLK